MDHLRKALEKSDSDHSSTVRDWMQPRRDGEIRAQVSPALQVANSRVVATDKSLFSVNRLVAASDENPAVLDRYRLLRTRLQQLLKPNRWSTIGITSSAPEAGKTVTTLNLAITFARAETTRVVVIDADLRKPSIASMLGLNATQGLAEYLAGTAELDDVLYRPEGIDNLSVIPGAGTSGTGTTNPSELLASPRFDTLIKSLRATEALVFIDTPPLQVGDDVLSVAQRTDCFLLVIEEGKTTVEELREGSTLLREHNLVGTVLNKSSTPMKRFQSYYAGAETADAARA